MLLARFSVASEFSLECMRGPINQDIKKCIGISSVSFEIPDEPPCYVRQKVSVLLLILFMCLGILASHICVLCMYTALHNCLSLGFAGLCNQCSIIN